MSLRVSRQVSEVLAQGSGGIRVSRQGVEILTTNPMNKGGIPCHFVFPVK